MKSVADAYILLEIKSSASDAEVKLAYKKLALKTHPDKNQNDPNSNDKFHKTAEAYQIIMSDRKRRGTSSSARHSYEEEDDYEDDEDYDDFEYDDDEDKDQAYRNDQFARAMFEFMFGFKVGTKSRGMGKGPSMPTPSFSFQSSTFADGGWRTGRPTAPFGFQNDRAASSGGVRYEFGGFETSGSREGGSDRRKTVGADTNSSYNPPPPPPTASTSSSYAWDTPQCDCPNCRAARKANNEYTKKPYVPKSQRPKDAAEEQARAAAAAARPADFDPHEGWLSDDDTNQKAGNTQGKKAGGGKAKKGAAKKKKEKSRAKSGITVYNFMYYVFLQWYSHTNI